MIPWGVQEPPADSGAVPLVSGDYICAVGSQARDYASLIEAVRGLPEIRLALVAYPENLRGISIPDNVTVFLNIPLHDVFNIVRHSRFMVLPLLHSEVPCGHVTIVTAMYLGKAVLATESAGITDYVHFGQTGLMSPSGDPSALAAKIRLLWNDSPLGEQLGAAGRQCALAHFTEQTTVDYLRKILDRFETTGAL
jgi:glycosyltransferase involved in cell wall biosynthesis